MENRDLTNDQVTLDSAYPSQVLPRFYIIFTFESVGCVDGDACCCCCLLFVRLLMLLFSLSWQRHAILKHKVGIKCATITPDEKRVEGNGCWFVVVVCSLVIRRHVMCGIGCHMCCKLLKVSIMAFASPLYE
jgi:hypothetical protein